MKKHQNSEHMKKEHKTAQKSYQYLLSSEKSAKNSLPLTKEVQEQYRFKGAKFMSDLKEVKFTPGKRVAVSENKSSSMKKGNWGPYRKGVVVGDYPLFVQINHGESWKNESYLKKDILIGRVIIKRQGYDDNIC
ncbi:MAG: hypothetical protein ACOX4L_03505 [Bacillota bacterium]|jgi:hypothetical protein